MINQQEEVQLRSLGVRKVLMLEAKGKAINIFQCSSKVAGSDCNSLSRGRPKARRMKRERHPVFNDFKIERTELKTLTGLIFIDSYSFYELLSLGEERICLHAAGLYFS